MTNQVNQTVYNYTPKEFLSTLQSCYRIQVGMFTKKSGAITSTIQTQLTDDTGYNPKWKVNARFPVDYTTSFREMRKTYKGTIHQEDINEWLDDIKQWIKDNPMLRQHLKTGALRLGYLKFGKKHEYADVPMYGSLCVYQPSNRNITIFTNHWFTSLPVTLEGAMLDANKTDKPVKKIRKGVMVDTGDINLGNIFIDVYLKRNIDVSDDLDF